MGGIVRRNFKERDRETLLDVIQRSHLKKAKVQQSGNKEVMDYMMR